MDTKRLEDLVKRQAMELRSAKKENKRLKKALQNFVADTEDEDEDEEFDEFDENNTEDDRISTCSSDVIILEDSVLRDPFFDGDAYRCNSNNCGFEVVEGQCQFCGKMYNYSKDHDRKFTGYELSIGTNINWAIHPDRSLVPRGDTPLLDCLPTMPPDTYTSRIQEYRQLLQRGATRLMCETFHLSFEYEEGIYALADQDLFEEFSGPKMKEGDIWKIHLGRRIELAEDDTDGSAFIEALLEDAFYFPFRESFSQRDFEKWHTFQAERGVWITSLEATRPEEDERMDIEEDEDEDKDPDRESDDEDNDHCFDLGMKNGDRLLEHPEEYDNGILRANDYEEEIEETGETDSEAEKEEAEELSENQTKFTEPDSVWAENEEDDDIEPSSEGDSCDSDFDSGEETSGDEISPSRPLQDGSLTGS